MNSVILLAAVLAVFLVPAAAEFEEEWEKFKVDHNRRYDDSTEAEQRRQIFVDNVRKIHAHNKRYEEGRETYTQGINFLADQRSDENHFGLRI